MKERPILFSGPMVRALLAGTKTQTRRVVRMPDQYEWNFDKLCTPIDGFSRAHIGKFGALFNAPEYRWVAPDHPFHGFSPCPYGQPGDRLWVKETWRTAKSLDAKSPAAIGEMCIDAGYRTPWAPLAYEADGRRNSEWRGFEMGCDAEPGKTRVSIHMPRWASRITVEITAVRVERLQDISEADALAEGAPPSHPSIDRISREFGYADFSRSWYAQLWEQINGPGSWDANPFVWVVEFRRALP